MGFKAKIPGVSHSPIHIQCPPFYGLNDVEIPYSKQIPEAF